MAELKRDGADLVVALSDLEKLRRRMATSGSPGRRSAPSTWSMTPCMPCPG